MGKLKTFAPTQAIENQKTREEALKEFEDMIVELADKPFKKIDFNELMSSLDEDNRECERMSKKFIADPKSYDVTFNM